MAVKLGVILGAMAMVFLCGVSPANAAHPCGTIDVPGPRPARVATVSVGCREGKEIALAVYRLIAEENHLTHYRVDRFRCAAVLAETQVSCQHHKEWVFASTQPTDHPADWHVPHQAKPYWKHCAPPPAVVSGDMLSHRVKCAKARKVIRKVLVKSQTTQTPRVDAFGYTCSLHPYKARPISCRKGPHRILSPLAG
jgi:hypothetical protein